MHGVKEILWNCNFRRCNKNRMKFVKVSIKLLFREKCVVKIFIFKQNTENYMRLKAMSVIHLFIRQSKKAQNLSKYE